MNHLHNHSMLSSSEGNNLDPQEFSTPKNQIIDPHEYNLEHDFYKKRCASQNEQEKKDFSINLNFGKHILSLADATESAFSNSHLSQNNFSVSPLTMHSNQLDNIGFNCSSPSSSNLFCPTFNSENFANESIFNVAYCSTEVEKTPDTNENGRNLSISSDTSVATLVDYNEAHGLSADKQRGLGKHFEDCNFEIASDTDITKEHFEVFWSLRDQEKKVLKKRKLINSNVLNSKKKESNLVVLKSPINFSR